MAKVGLILGSGLKDFASNYKNSELIYSDQKSFHKKEVLKTRVENVETLIFSGRDHYYEGAPESKIFENIDICLKNSIELVVITNAAGGLNKIFRVSDIMLITSFIDCINIYNRPVKFTRREVLQNIASLAARNNIPLRKGVYFAMKGPNYETTSEVKYLRKTGADAVGMSTVPEIKYAIDNGLKVIALSCITNLLYEGVKFETTHDEVEQAGRASYQYFSKLIKLIVKNFQMFLK